MICNYYSSYSENTLGCGREITEETEISGANIDPQNNDFTRCTWNITAPENRIVNVKYVFTT